MRAVVKRMTGRGARRVIAYSLASVVLAMIGLAMVEIWVARSPGLASGATGRPTSGAVGEVESDLTEPRGVIGNAWAGMLDQARSRLEESLGIFVYRAGSPDSEPQWARINERESVPNRVVIMIHGLDDSGAIWDDLAPAAAAAGHTVLRFDYPNDQSIVRSAVRLELALQDLHDLGVEHVDLVCHSMGGLVAREVLTRAPNEADSSDGRFPSVDRLIMVGTPQQGSELARFRAVMEVRDQFVRLCERDGLRPVDLLAFLVDGDGQAGDDLLPGSAFLERLNARPLPPDTRITVIIGRAGANGDGTPPSPTDAAGGSVVARALGKPAAEYLHKWVDQQLRTIGDGAVTAGSAELEGVEDVVYLPAAHRTLLRRMPLLGRNGEPPAIEVILDRLDEPIDGG